MDVFLDMHIHSCLSPCASEDMTPNNIVNMAIIKGLDMIAVTDHNTAGNLPAVFDAASNSSGICVVPGIEINTSEEVHVLAYFEELQDALALSGEIYKYLPEIENNPRFFGEQTIMDGEDNIIGVEKKLLLSPLTLDIDETVALIRKHRGIPVPAHIDKTSNGIVQVLGFIPENLGIKTAEISKSGIEHGFDFYDKSIHILSSSDAHMLGDIFEKTRKTELEEISIKAFIEKIA